MGGFWRGVEGRRRMLVAYVSGHGFGHATRVGEVLRVLRARLPHLALTVVSAAPEEIFRAVLPGDFGFQARACDVGLVQRGALEIDEPASARAWLAFAADWQQRVRDEARFLRGAGARLVLADVPPLACAAAAHAGLPAVVLANFSWDWIYRHLASRQPVLGQAADECAAAYAATTLLLRLPFAGDLAVFPRVADVGFVARRPRCARADARRRLGLDADLRPLVLLSFGGLGLPDFDAHVLRPLDGFRFVLSLAQGPLPSHVHVIDGGRLREAGLGYVDLVGAADVVVTKPGYGIVTDALAAGTRLLYTPRGDFPEYPVLVREMPRHLACAPLASEDLYAGRLTPALEDVARAAAAAGPRSRRRRARRSRPAGASVTSRAPRPATPWALYATLTLAVWGLFALDRGPWHDDVQNLFRALAAPGRGEGLFPVLASPTRKLLAWPFFLALGSGRPRLALELMLGCGWLATGVLAQRLARRLWPDDTRAAWLAGVLTLTATSDFFTDATVAVGYVLSIAAYLLAVEAGFAWLHSGRPSRLAGALLALCASLWTTDAAAVACLVTPLAWWAAPRAPDAAARTRRLIGLWYLTAAPYAALVVAQLASGRGYLRAALIPLAWDERARRLAQLVAWNFEPWSWAFARPLWQPSPGEVVPLAARLGLALLLGAASALIIQRVPRAAREAGRLGPLAASLTLMLASNAPFAGVQLAEFYCRTHLLARVWASLALVDVVRRGWELAAPSRVARAALVAALAGWIALGVAGGLERQDYYAAYARRHAGELGSLLGAVPGLRPDAALLLRVERADAYLATEAGYLARAWAALLYADARVECRVVLASRARGEHCQPTEQGLVCQVERSPDCRALDGRASELLPYERLVIVDYDAARNRYLRRDALPLDAGGADPRLAARYAPARNVVAAAPSALARELVLERGGLAAWLWPR